jgi:hypothetical protein
MYSWRLVYILQFDTIRAVSNEPLIIWNPYVTFLDYRHLYTVPLNGLLHNNSLWK